MRSRCGCRRGCRRRRLHLLDLDRVVVLGWRSGAVCVAPTRPAETPELLKDSHHRQLHIRHLLGNRMPDHQVPEVGLAEAAALGGFQVVHEGEDTLALGGVARDEYTSFVQESDTRLDLYARSALTGQLANE